MELFFLGNKTLLFVGIFVKVNSLVTMHDHCSACSLLTYDWSVDLSFGLHLPTETFELCRTIGYRLFVAVDNLILS